MSVMTSCRRKKDRHILSEDLQARIEFAFPEPGGHSCEMALRDLSSGGLSFTLAHDLPGLEVGDCLKRATLHVGDQTLEGDVLIMHITPELEPGAVCGALFYPARDIDIITLQRVVQAIEENRVLA